MNTWVHVQLWHDLLKELLCFYSCCHINQSTELGVAQATSTFFLLKAEIRSLVEARLKVQKWLGSEQQSSSFLNTKWKGSGWNYDAGLSRASWPAHPKSCTQILSLQLKTIEQNQELVMHCCQIKTLWQVTHWTCPLQKIALWVHSPAQMNEPS